MKASRGPRRRTRHVLSKSPRKRGLSPITYEFQDFEVGERVNIVLDPSIHRGMPHPRFHGKTGTVVGNQGKAFVVKVRDGNKLKTVVSRPEHLRKSA
ncbi:MAG TPA: 50S ribosomal protein L21e [Methanomassiliicoccales archaeon]|nr:50S ribosomal protein L21e [Methanomassiliicoccales archaeon]